MAGLMAKRMAAKGRGGDTHMVHATTGEIMVPPAVADRPGTRETLARSFEETGVPMEKYTVGSPSASINPETGQEEYSLDMIFEGAKALADVGTSFIGGVGGAAASFLGGGGSALNVAMNIFGGIEKDTWGHIIGSVGAELMKPDMVEERLRYDRKSAEERRKRTRRKFGLPENPGQQRPGENAARYQRGNGLLPSRTPLYSAGA